MQRSEETSLGDISLSLPVKIAYPVLEELLEDKIQGKSISVNNKEGGKTNYAEILEVHLGESSDQDFDIALEVKFRALASFLKGKTGRAILHLSLHFDEEQQRLGIKEYRLQGKNDNWLADKFLQVLVNSWLKEKLKKKMNFDLRPHIQKRLQSVNTRLEQDMELKEGIALSGVIKDFRVCDVIAGQSLLLIIVKAEASALIDIQKIQI